MTLYNLMPWKKKSTPVPRENEHPIYSMQREMNRMFDDFFRDDEDTFSGFGLAPFSSMRATADSLTPTTDLSETDKELIVTMELPGIEEKDIEVNLTRNTLTVSGEKKQEESKEEKGWYRMERHYGSFARTLPLPCEVDVEKIDATFKNGVLKVKLPKVSESIDSAKRISVKKG